jgi:hypothetical protein
MRATSFPIAPVAVLTAAIPASSSGNLAITWPIPLPTRVGCNRSRRGGQLWVPESSATPPRHRRHAAADPDPAGPFARRGPVGHREKRARSRKSRAGWINPADVERSESRYRAGRVPAPSATWSHRQQAPVWPRRMPRPHRMSFSRVCSGLTAISRRLDRPLREHDGADFSHRSDQLVSQLRGIASAITSSPRSLGCRLSPTWQAEPPVLLYAALRYSESYGLAVSRAKSTTPSNA